MDPVEPVEGAERRRFTRFPLNILATLQLHGNVRRDCTIANFSAVGMALLHKPKLVPVDARQRVQIRHGESVSVSFELASRQERLRAIGVVRRARRHHGLVEIGLEFEHIDLLAYRRLIRLSDSTQILESMREARSQTPVGADQPWLAVGEFIQAVSDAAIARVSESLLLHAEHATRVDDRAPYFYALIDLRARGPAIIEQFVRRIANRSFAWLRAQGHSSSDGRGTVVSILSNAAEAASRRAAFAGTANDSHAHRSRHGAGPSIGAAAHLFDEVVRREGARFDPRLVHAPDGPFTPRALADCFLQAGAPFANDSPIRELVTDTLEDLLRLHHVRLGRRLAGPLRT
ncbi:MAG: PilZ domain-containing protein [Gammaproteobacteria bacterium]|nr:PilZ domain-containing protein [Gammaproteobacteria bacterium]